MSIREFRRGDIVRVKDPTRYDNDGGYDGTFRVVRSHFIPDTIDPDDEWNDSLDEGDFPYVPQTQREQFGHSQFVYLRVTRHKRHILAWKAGSRSKFRRNHKTILFSGALLELVERKTR